jgi:hypothetical protein
MIPTQDQCGASLPAGRDTLIAQARFVPAAVLNEHAIRLLAELTPRHQRTTRPAASPRRGDTKQEQEP